MNLPNNLEDIINSYLSTLDKHIQNNRLEELSMAGYKSLCQYYIKINDFNMVKQTYHITTYKYNLCSTCATYNRQIICKWLIDQGCKWENAACYAAANNNLEFLKWAKTVGCPVDTNACTSAAASGNLEVLKWLISNNCPINKYVTLYAKINKRQSILTWLKKH